MYRNTQACDFIKGEMFWYLIKDGESEDMGKKKTLFLGGGGEIWKKMGLYFLQIQSRSNLVLMTFWDTWTLKVLRNIHAPDDIKSVKF